jgi:hypothetical protein
MEVSMDMTEASAMTTEASGLTGDEALTGDEVRIQHASEAIRDMTSEMRHNRVPLAPSEPMERRLSERLRQMTREAPLQSLAIAFLLGVLVARRR